jgi:hypothetical protein
MTKQGLLENMVEFFHNFHKFTDATVSNILTNPNWYKECMTYLKDIASTGSEAAIELLHKLNQNHF